MHMTKRLAVVALAASLGSLAFAFAARGDGGDGHGERGGAAIRSALAPSQPTDPAFHGMPPGGAPWSLDQGSVRLRGSGKLRLEVEGLVLTSLGTAGPITGIAASVFCGADSVTTPVATTPVAPLSSSGDGEIDARVSVPGTCLAPLVLVRPANASGLLSVYIAIEGFRP